MSDRTAPLLPHELDGITDTHLRDRILASLDAAQEEARRLQDSLEEELEKAKEKERNEADAEWLEKYNGLDNLLTERREELREAREEAKAALKERDEIILAVAGFLGDGIVRQNKKALKSGLCRMAETLRKADLLGPVEEAEAKGAADYLAKA